MQTSLSCGIVHYAGSRVMCQTFYKVSLKGSKRTLHIGRLLQRKPLSKNRVRGLTLCSVTTHQMQNLAQLCCSWYTALRNNCACSWWALEQFAGFVGAAEWAGVGWVVGRRKFAASWGNNLSHSIYSRHLWTLPLKIKHLFRRLLLPHFHLPFSRTISKSAVSISGEIQVVAGRELSWRMIYLLVWLLYHLLLHFSTVTTMRFLVLELLRAKIYRGAIFQLR